MAFIVSISILVLIMWSPIYTYYYIKSDSGEIFDIKASVIIMLQFPELEQVGQVTSQNVEGFPWFSLSAVYETNGGYSVSDVELPQNSPVNLISIVCSKKNEVDLERCEVLFLELAQRFGWKLHLEEDDFGNEDFEIKVSKI